MEEDRGPGSRPSLLPLAVGALTLLAVIGAAAHGGVRLSDRGPLADQRGPLIAIGMLLLVVDVLVISMVRRAMRRKRRLPEVEIDFRGGDDDTPKPWWVTLLFYLVFVALLALPVILVYLALRNSDAEPEEAEEPQVDVPNLDLPEDTVANSTITLLMLLSLAAIVIAVIVTYAQTRAGRRISPFVAGEPSREVDEAALASAVAAGEVAMRSSADPREAIIACYAAMEATLAEHGSPRWAADTPSELLDRAAAAGLVRSDASGVLTDLFRQARFSTHPMRATDASAASAALARLRTDLGVRA